MQKYVILITAITHFNFLLVLLVKTHVKSMPGRFPELLKKKEKRKKEQPPCDVHFAPLCPCKVGARHCQESKTKSAFLSKASPF